MASPSMPTSATLFVLICTIFFPTEVPCSKADDIPYDDHCGMIVPAATPVHPETTTIPFPPDQDGHFLGGGDILKPPNSSDYFLSSSSERKMLLFRTHHVYATKVDDVYKLEASLIIQPSGMNYYVQYVSHSYSLSTQVVTGTSERGSLIFELHGFWSKSSGKLCMVGSGSTYSQKGERMHDLQGVLKLDGVESWSNMTSLVRGTMESLSSSDVSSTFDPISLMMFPQMNYKYTKVLKEFDHWIDVAEDSSLSLPLSIPICSILTGRTGGFQLVYGSNCSSTKRCNPFREVAGYLPQIMSLNVLKCGDAQNLRFLLDFPNGSYVPFDRPFTPDTVLVAEGSWDPKKNQFSVVACRILDATVSYINSRVDDCSIRMSLRFPAVWSIRNTNGMEGRMWSTKEENDPGYFDRIEILSQESTGVKIPGHKYVYTSIERAKKACPKKNPGGNTRRQYPEANSTDMSFDMSVKNSSGTKFGWGYSQPLFVGDQIVPSNRHMSFSISETVNSKNEAKTNSSAPVNISYKMNFPALNASAEDRYFQIWAEGVYVAETGQLCMVGCRYLASNLQVQGNDSMDCEIFINVEFPPTDSNDHIKGDVKSTREKLDPLYFQSLSFSAVSPYRRYASEEKWRMDLEIIMALTSNTLMCFFVGYQILYLKRHRNVFPFVSLSMLFVLALGHMIPLLLNFEALFSPKQKYGQFSMRVSGGWLEINEVIVRVVTMLAFLLQCRLLQIVCSARLAAENQKASWVAEKRTLFIVLPLYTVGGLIVLFVNRKSFQLGDEMHSRRFYNGQHPLWMGFRSYAGLLLDGFLIPQILVNIFQNSSEKALSFCFYIGTTLIRLLPHAYDLYRAHYYDDDFDWSYRYASPDADYYSTAWNVVIPLGGMMFAAVIYLQQRFGGRCFLPRRFKEMPEYEKVPMDSEA